MINKIYKADLSGRENIIYVFNDDLNNYVFRLVGRFLSIDDNIAFTISWLFYENKCDGFCIDNTAFNLLFSDCKIKEGLNDINSFIWHLNLNENKIIELTYALYTQAKECDLYGEAFEKMQSIFKKCADNVEYLTKDTQTQTQSKTQSKTALVFKHYIGKEEIISSGNVFDFDINGLIYNWDSGQDTDLTGIMCLRTQDKDIDFKYIFFGIEVSKTSYYDLIDVYFKIKGEE